MPANDKSDWQIEKNKQKITTTKHGHRCSRLASGRVRFLGHYSQTTSGNTTLHCQNINQYICSVEPIMIYVASSCTLFFHSGSWHDERAHQFGL